MYIKMKIHNRPRASPLLSSRPTTIKVSIVSIFLTQLKNMYFPVFVFYASFDHQSSFNNNILK